VVVTLAWLVPLTLALGLRGVPWGVFAGQVNQGALILPLDWPPSSTRAVLLLALWSPPALAALLGRRGMPWRRVLLGGVLVSGLIAVLPVGYVMDGALMEDPTQAPWLDYLNNELGGLFIWVPTIAAWLGLVMLAVARVRRAPADLLVWYLLLGTLLALSLYPRVDTVHAMFSGPLLLVVGAWGLAWLHRVLTRGLPVAGQAVVYLALLVVPVASVAPHVAWRYVTITHPDPRASTAPSYVSPGLERAPVLVPEHVAAGMRGAVEYVRAGTPPGAPFFAYPVDPLFNFLADRPNPTRFNHFIAGALTPSDLQEVIRDLDRSRPRYVLWDLAGARYFEIDRTNGALNDYIRTCYRETADFAPFVILERACP
jgi:hypothetical protein